MTCGVFWQQIKELERALGALQHLGIETSNPAYQLLFGMRGKMMKQIGFKFPRSISSIARVLALSPGNITLWHDVESGWMSEARAKPGAPPVYKSVSDETAVAIIKGEITHELEEQLMTPDEYIGE